MFHFQKHRKLLNFSFKIFYLDNDDTMSSLYFSFEIKYTDPFIILYVQEALQEVKTTKSDIVNLLLQKLQ